MSRFHYDFYKYTEQKKRNVPCIFEVCFLWMQLLFCKFYFIYELREVFTAFKMNIMTEASNLMSKDQFDVRKGPDVKVQFKHAF